MFFFEKKFLSEKKSNTFACSILLTNKKVLNMKKLLYSILFIVLFFQTSQAQFDADKIFAGANVAYARPIGDFQEYAKGGFSYNALAGYDIAENFGVGIEYGSAATVALDDSLSTGILGVNIYGLRSFIAKGWYRFGSNNFKPYVGLGVGLAQVAEPDFTSGTTTIKGAKRIGLGANVELGLNFSGFNLSYSFNVSGKGPKEPVFNENVADLNLNYHRFAAGYIYNF